MKALNTNAFHIKNILGDIKDDLRKEQKAFFFHKKDKEEEKEYFDFFKFIFQSPDLPDASAGF
jgi:hypothetical protein